MVCNKIKLSVKHSKMYFGPVAYITLINYLLTYLLMTIIVQIGLVKGGPWVIRYQDLSTLLDNRACNISLSATFPWMISQVLTFHSIICEK